MKWLYRYSLSEEIMVLANIQIPERMRELDMEYVNRVHDIPEIHSIHDSRFIEHAVDDITYFCSIGMVVKSKVAL